MANDLHPTVEDIDPDADFDFPEFPDVNVDIGTYKACRERAVRIWHAKQDPMLRAMDADGRPLYRVSSGGNLIRTTKTSARLRRQVVERDGNKCVLCGGARPFHVDHIVRYVDGGPTALDNLRTLCVPCHNKRGGRA